MLEEDDLAATSRRAFGLKGEDAKGINQRIFRASIELVRARNSGIVSSWLFPKHDAFIFKLYPSETQLQASADRIAQPSEKRQG
jgi:hypothetical protein